MWSYILRTNEKGWRTRIRHQTPILSCSGVAIPLVKKVMYIPDWNTCINLIGNGNGKMWHAYKDERNVPLTQYITNA